MSFSRAFQDRQDAGRQLAEVLLSFRDEQPIVMALPNGGVVVGFEVARRLEAPLDVIVVRKLGAPHNPELGIGAIGPLGIRLLNARLIRELRITEAQVVEVTEREERTLIHRTQRYRGDRPMPDLSGKTVLIVDDGLATGVTARVAIEAARERDAAKVILAVPVGAPDSVALLSPAVDKLICLRMPDDFKAVGHYYGSFRQVDDETVLDLLRRASPQMSPTPNAADDNDAYETPETRRRDYSRHGHHA
jgi:putative phosphoribosyl transferase